MYCTFNVLYLRKVMRRMHAGCRAGGAASEDWLDEGWKSNKLMKWLLMAR